MYTEVTCTTFVYLNTFCVQHLCVWYFQLNIENRKQEYLSSIDFPNCIITSLPFYGACPPIMIQPGHAHFEIRPYVYETRFLWKCSLKKGVWWNQLDYILPRFPFWEFFTFGNFDPFWNKRISYGTFSWFHLNYLRIDNHLEDLYHLF